MSVRFMLRCLSSWDACYVVSAGRQPRPWGMFPISVAPVDTARAATDPNIAPSPGCLCWFGIGSGRSVLQCAYDRPPAVVAHLARRRSGSGDPAAVYAVATQDRTLRDEWDRLVVQDGSVPPRRQYRPATDPFGDPDLRAITEATQVLEQARLLMRTFKDDSYIGLTRLGMHALQTNTVRQHLGLGDTPPTT
jgi:hypothetical protein